MSDPARDSGPGADGTAAAGGASPPPGGVERLADPRFHAAIVRTLGAAHRQAADATEVLATIGRVEDAEPDTWVAAWTEVAVAAAAAAAAASARGLAVSALTHYRRAATYYGAALELVAQSRASDRKLELWRQQRLCWERTVDLSPVAGERLAIPYGRAALPGYFFRAPDASPASPRPLVVVNNDSDAPTSHAWVAGGAAAGERGYHWMTFDGPGQQAALLEQGIPARPDWEAVLTPVLEALVARDDVDPLRIAVIGVGQAGYLVPRALAFEHRFAAAVANPGVVDVSTAWIEQLPDVLRAQLVSGEHAVFDREMALAKLFRPEIRALWSDATRYGPSTSASALYETIAGYRLGEEVSRIGTPLLVTDIDPQRRWPGQARRLYDRLPGPKEFLGSAAPSSTHGRGQPLGDVLRETLIFDWLDRHLAPAARADPNARRRSDH